MRAALTTVHEHPRHVVLAAFVAGLLVGPVSWWLVPAVVPPLAIAAWHRGTVLLALTAVLAGASFAEARLRALDAGALAAAAGQGIETRAVLLEPARVRAGGTSYARVRLLDGIGAGEQAVLRISKWALRDGGDAPEIGETVRVVGRIEPLGPFDAYQRRRNAHALVVADRVERTGRRRGGVQGALDGVRRRAERGLDSRLAPAEAALLRGMVLGQDERLTDEVEEDFQRSGLAHILAVSGSNVMLLAVLVLAAAALIGLPLRARLLVAIGVIVVYVPLTGAGPSIQRAGVMGVAGLVASLSGRPTRRWYALLLAAAVTLMLNPRAVGEPGWQLSFAAVVALLIAAKPLSETLTRALPRPVAEAAAITIAATVGTAPLMALHFGEVSLAALPANLLAAPAIAPIMWLGVLAAAGAQLSLALAAPFSALSGPLLVYVQKVAETTASTSLSAVKVGTGAPLFIAGWLVIVYLLARATRRWRYGRSHRRATPVVTAAAAAIVAALVLAGGLDGRGADAATPGPNELRISFLDVGQGDATLIELGRTSVLVDTGVVDGPILERLDESGIRRLDALILTHAEADHEGAALPVIRRFEPRLVLDGGAGWPTLVQQALPAAIAAVHGRQVAPAAGQTLQVGGLRFDVLWPPPNDVPSGNPNDHAVVARMTTADGFAMLLSADAESNVTAPLPLEPVDVLKVAHHGSADPGLPALLGRLRPQVAAIEVGRGNPYGHPTPSTIGALERVVPTVLRTDRDGTVRLHVLRGQMWVRK